MLPGFQPLTAAWSVTRHPVNLRQVIINGQVFLNEDAEHFVRDILLEIANQRARERRNATAINQFSVLAADDSDSGVAVGSGNTPAVDAGTTTPNQDYFSMGVADTESA
jgi:hypothetical protein